MLTYNERLSFLILNRRNVKFMTENGLLTYLVVLLNTHM